MCWVDRLSRQKTGSARRTVKVTRLTPLAEIGMRRYVSYTRVEDRIFSLTFETHFSNPFNDPQPI
jgi:hypothetical protein